MKLNERSLAFYATCDSPADNAGFLYKKGERHTAYHRRWFVLKGNMLFYFEDRESREPVGVIVLEGCTVELCESTEEFAFAIKFGCARSRTYVLVAESQAAMESWVKSLSRASFDYLRLVVRELEQQLAEMQRNLPGHLRVQRRTPLYWKSKAASPPRLESAAPEKPAVPICTPVKENGCALWSNPEGPSGVPGGYPPTDSWGRRACEGPDTDGSQKPPPLPPRRRVSAGNSCVSGGPSAEGPGYPGAACFTRLHDWYGKEILELRRAWLDGRKDSGL